MTDPDRTDRDDEALSALLDGELPEAEAERLGKRLAREPALAERLAQFEQADAKLREAYGGLVDEPLPRAVVDLLETGEAAGPASTGAAGGGAHAATDAGTTRTGADNVVELQPRRRDPRQWFSLPAAAAAGIALVVGVLVGNLIGPGEPTREDAALIAAAGAVEPGTRLHAVLESTPSAETLELGDDVSATPRLSFRSRDGDYCRQVDLTSARGTTETLACRQGGRWQLEVSAFAPRTGASEGVYRPAAGEDSAVGAAVDSMIAGDPLGADREQTLIANGWQTR